MRTRLAVAAVVLALALSTPASAPATPNPCGGSPTAECVSVRVPAPVRVGRLERIIASHGVPDTAALTITRLSATRASVYFYWDEG